MMRNGNVIDTRRELIVPKTAVATTEQKLVFDNFLPCRFKAINEKSVRLLTNTHESLGISAPEFSIMVVLAEHDGVSSRDINKTTGMDKATITRALDRLIDKELISRTKSKEDSRLIKLKLNAKGKRTFTQIEENALAWEREFVQGVKMNELNNLLTILNKLDANLDRLDNI